LNPLELWPVAAVRRNHALEHATIHVLSERHPDLRVVGRSDWGGFTLFGPLDTADVTSAVTAALRRLRAGESHLAVHPSCGTNVSTGVVLAGLASFAALHGKRRSRLEKTLQLIAGLAGAFVLAQPLGVRVQERLTTSADVLGLRVSDVRRQERGSLVMHRIRTVLE
jgi:hypothetical protein